MLFTIVGMAVGVIFSNKKLRGSCGGLNKVLGDDCMFCEKKDRCSDEKKEKCEGPTPDLLKILISLVLKTPSCAFHFSVLVLHEKRLLIIPLADLSL